jgi:fructose-1,6-bisphosphatase/inositol monophosphatase family enzyme
VTDAPPPLPPSGRRLRDLLIAAGEASLACWSPAMGVDRKSDGTPVTAADLAAERVLLAGLRDGWPGEPLESEEGGGDAPSHGAAAARWVVDPLDGTSAFTEGLAHWGPTVARLAGDGDAERVVLGALYLPRTREHWHVEDGVAWADGVRLAALRAGASAGAVVLLPSEFHRSGTIDWPGKTRCLGGTAAHLALVARGSARAAVVAPGWKVWDVAAGLALIEAVAGGAYRIPDGAPLVLARDVGVPFVAGVTDVAFDLAANGRIRAHLTGAANGT